MKILFLIAIFASVNSAWAQGKLSVAAAADLRSVMPALVQAFEKERPEIHVDVSFGASGSLTTQIEQKAPYDLFFSADSSYPERLISEGLAEKNFKYAKGSLVVWFSKKSSLHWSRTDLEKKMDLLLLPAVKKIAIANPTTAPYGKAAAAALQKEELYEKIKSKLIFGENIAQTAQFAQMGGADIGIIALSLALSPELQRDGDYFAVPSEDYTPLIQSFTVLKNASNPAAAELFKAFILDAKTKTIFSQFGFEN